MAFRPTAPLSSSPAGFSRMRPALAAGLVAALGWLLLRLAPALELEVFAYAAARGAALLTGSPVVRVAEGWMLSGLHPRLVVSAACSATDYFLITSTLCAWHLARKQGALPVTIAGSLAVALPATWLINAVRVVFVGQAHHWIIPLFPEAYASFLHLFAGVVVFLPALIALNLLLELHGHSSHCPR